MGLGVVCRRDESGGGRAPRSGAEVGSRLFGATSPAWCRSSWLSGLRLATIQRCAEELWPIGSCLLARDGSTRQQQLYSRTVFTFAFGAYFVDDRNRIHTVKSVISCLRLLRCRAAAVAQPSCSTALALPKR